MQFKTVVAIVLVIDIIIAVWAVSYWRSKYPNDQDTSKLIDQNFLDFVSQRKQLPQPTTEVSLIAVGDIMLSRTVASKIRARNDFNYPFRKVSDFLNDADITFGNLENPIIDGAPVAPFQMRFRADPGVEHALKKAGFDILSLANNHTPDYGAKGIKDTIDYLNKVGILSVGAGQNSLSANSPLFLSRGTV